MINKTSKSDAPASVPQYSIGLDMPKDTLSGELNISFIRKVHIPEHSGHRFHVNLDSDSI